MAKQTVRDITFDISNGIINIHQGDQYIVIVQADLDVIKKLIEEDDSEMARVNDELEVGDEVPDFGGQIGAENDAHLSQYD